MRRSLGSASESHVADARAGFDIADRNAKLAVKDLVKKECRQAFRHMTLATANYHSAVAHAVSSGERDALLREFEKTTKLVYRVIRGVQRKCLP